MVFKINTNTVLHHLSTRTDAILFIFKISSGLLVEWISPESSERHLFIKENFVKSSRAVGLIQISILHHSFWQWLIYSIKIKMRDSEIEKCISSLSYLPQVSQMFIWQLWRVQLDSITKLSTAPNPGWPTKRKSLMTAGPETTLLVYKQMLIICFMSAG